MPLPRTVGIETDDDLLCLAIDCDEDSVPRDQDTPPAVDCSSRIKASLAGQLPAGCELISISLAKQKTSFQPCLATYVLPIRQEYVNDRLTDRVEHLLASEHLNLQRQIGVRNSNRPGRQNLKLKNVDVRPFLKSIKADDNNIVVECIITSAGSIRVQEILDLLELDTEKLAGPVRRTSIEWKNN